MVSRAADYGSHRSPPDPSLPPEKWVAEEKPMPGALREYQYAEDREL